MTHQNKYIDMEQPLYINGKAIYTTGGAAKEYSPVACNLHKGCAGECDYCYLKFGPWSKTLGKDRPILQKSFLDDNHAYAVFAKEFKKYHPQIVSRGGLFFSFSTDPCAPEVFPLYYRCMMKALGFTPEGERDKASPGAVIVKLLTKRTEWIDTPEGELLLKRGGDNLEVGFTLTGHDEHEPHTSPGVERVRAMKKAYDMGCFTWASIEPILDNDAEKAKEIITDTVAFCKCYKVGLLSVVTRKAAGVNYNPEKIRDFRFWVEDFCGSHHRHLFLKTSLREFLNMNTIG